MNTAGSTFRAGGVTFGGDQPEIESLEIGYDNNTDDAIATRVTT